jgi:hypothetical protein
MKYWYTHEQQFLNQLNIGGILPTSKVILKDDQQTPSRFLMALLKT